MKRPLSFCKDCKEWRPTGNYTYIHKQLGWCDFLKDYIAENKFCFNYEKGGGDNERTKRDL